VKTITAVTITTIMNAVFDGIVDPDGVGEGDAVGEEGVVGKPKA